MSSEGFNVHEAWEEVGVDPHDPNAMLKVLVRQKRELATMAGRVADLEKASTKCGQPALCAHNPDGGNHPKVSERF